MNIRDVTFLTLGVMGTAVALRWAFGLDHMIVSIAQPVFARVPAVSAFCTAVHSAAESTMGFSQAGLLARSV